jgi:hypothetical protein
MGMCPSVIVKLSLFTSVQGMATDSDKNLMLI